VKEKVRRGINARIDYLNSSIASEVDPIANYFVNMVVCETISDTDERR
jgi:hypothetical protein